MTDEICLLNLNAHKDAHFDQGNTIVNDRTPIIQEKIMINLLLGYFWTDVVEVKKRLKFICRENPPIERILQKIAHVDPKNKKIRVKEEYSKQYDPYLFYRVPHIQRDISQNFASRIKKDD